MINFITEILQLQYLQIVNRNVDITHIVDMDLYRMNVYVIQTQWETHTKFVVQWKEIHVQTRNVESEQNVVKQTMVESNAFVQLVTLAIHL